MILLISSSLLISLSISIILSTSPLAIGFWVLLIALSCSFLSAVTFNSWFSIIIFLVYIGGILVIFAYFSALTPNQPLGLRLIFPLSFMAFLLISITSAISPILAPFASSSKFISRFSSITLIYSPSNVSLLLFLAIILFFILVAVVKITNITFGPLRPFNYV